MSPVAHRVEVGYIPFESRPRTLSFRPVLVSVERPGLIVTSNSLRRRNEVFGANIAAAKID